MALKVSLGLPTPRDGSDYIEPDALAEVAAEAEAAGIDACHLSDHPAPVLRSDQSVSHTLDPLITLAYIARATRTIQLRTRVLILPYRNPLLVASMAATLQHLSRGRFILGVGAGYLPDESAALGADYWARNTIIEESIETIRAAWTGRPVYARGHGWSAAGNSIHVSSRGPAPAIWMAGNSQSAMERSARLCSGWICQRVSGENAAAWSTASITSLDELADRMRRLAAIRSSIGKVDQFDVCFGPGADWVGMSESRIREEMEQMEAMGVTWVAVGFPTSSRPNLVERVRALASLLRTARTARSTRTNVRVDKVVPTSTE